MGARSAALITGASAGIGWELARVFARNGHDLVLVARRGDRLQALAARLAGEHSIEAHVQARDLGDPRERDALHAWWRERGIVIDCLVNNAGFGAMGEFADLDAARQLAMLELNITALTDLTARCLPAMLERRSGRILNVASTAAFQPGPRMAVYYATKAYVLSFSEALSIELARRGVTVTALCPGPTATEFGEVAGVTDTRAIDVLRMTAEPVARAGYRGLMRGKAIVIPGIANRMLVQALRVTPRALVRRLVYRVQRGMSAPARGQ